VRKKISPQKIFPISPYLQLGSSKNNKSVVVFILLEKNFFFNFLNKLIKTCRCHHVYCQLGCCIFFSCMSETNLSDISTIILILEKKEKNKDPLDPGTKYRYSELVFSAHGVLHMSYILVPGFRIRHWLIRKYYQHSNPVDMYFGTHPELKTSSEIYFCSYQGLWVIFIFRDNRCIFFCPCDDCCTFIHSDKHVYYCCIFFDLQHFDTFFEMWSSRGESNNSLHTATVEKNKNKKNMLKISYSSKKFYCDVIYISLELKRTNHNIINSHKTKRKKNMFKKVCTRQSYIVKYKNKQEKNMLKIEFCFRNKFSQHMKIPFVPKEYQKNSIQKTHNTRTNYIRDINTEPYHNKYKIQRQNNMFKKYNNIQPCFNSQKNFHFKSPKKKHTINYKGGAKYTNKYDNLSITSFPRLTNNGLNLCWLNSTIQLSLILFKQIIINPLDTY